jgi:hypothetical protein
VANSNLLYIYIYRKDEDAFKSAADTLISAYIPEESWAALTGPVAAAASTAGVRFENPKSLVVSALEATERPEWFNKAIPAAYSTAVLALETAIDSLRPTAAAPGAIPTAVVVVTTVDGSGNTVVTTVSTIPTAITTAGPSLGVQTSTTISGSGSLSGSGSGTNTAAPSTTTSTGAGAIPTAMANNAAGVAAIFGLAMIL